MVCCMGHGEELQAPGRLMVQGVGSDSDRADGYYHLGGMRWWQSRRGGLPIADALSAI